MYVYSELIELSNGVDLSGIVWPPLNDYLNRIPKDKLPIKPIKFKMVYHRVKDIYESLHWNGFQDMFYGNNICDYPLVHLTTYDLFEHKIDRLQNPPRYSKIMDSSIWNYYIPLDVPVAKATGKDWEYSDNYELLIKILEEIANNTEKGLYNLEIAREYADFNARLVKQSFLVGGHKQVSPFLFHSENEMRRKIDGFNDTQKHTLTLEGIRKYRWRLLLLDDKGINHLSGTKKSENKENNNSTTGINKIQIIANNLTRILGFDENRIWFRTFDFDTKSDDPIKSFGRIKNGNFESAKEKPEKPEDIQIIIDCVKCVDEAEACLRKYRYEVVLLDYLLDKNKSGEIEYGYQLLENLLDWHHKKNDKSSSESSDKAYTTRYKSSPNNCFFFMFISAFATAVQERMLEKGFGRTEKDLWYIGTGACPTNTPYLFSYRLMLFMRHRLKDLRADNEEHSMTIIDLLHYIYAEKGNGGTEEVRQKAYSNFNNVLLMRNKYKKLETDLSEEDENYLNKNKEGYSADYLMNMDSSLLVQSIFRAVHHFSGAFFEHLQHLVYLTAFGTIRQWQDMWEEYVFIHEELCEYDSFIKKKIATGKNSNDESIKWGTDISDAIRAYIINLKENNY